VITFEGTSVDEIQRRFENQLMIISIFALSGANRLKSRFRASLWCALPAELHRKA